MIKKGYVPLSSRSFVVSASNCLLGLLPLGSSELSGLEDGGWGKINVLFRADSYQVAWNVDELFAN
jgi:hypothetical protein